jgi:zinc protease
MNLLRGLPLLAAVFIAFAAPVHNAAQTPEAPPDSAPWPLRDVEIVDSPLFTTGTLPNGLRYVIRPHNPPDGTLSLRLLVAAGSLHENDDERGFAHFVEHMAFNGTKHFPAGELVKYLQRQGAQFGPHVTAHTKFNSTVYRLDLPAHAPEALETGLRIFHDFADGLLFEPAEIKKERGVILSEKLTRRTPDSEESTAWQEFLYPHTRVPLRNPLGVSRQIETADRAALRRFYDAWYRPENLCVIIVGKVTPDAAKALIEKQFSSFAARGPARPVPPVGTVAPTSQPAIRVHAKQAPGARITFLSVSERPNLRSTWANQLLGLRVQTALSILRERLEKNISGPGAVINQALSGMEVDYLKFRRASLSVASAPKNIAPALTLLEQEIRRAIQFGFSHEEVAHEQALLRPMLRSVAEGTPTANSAEIASACVEYIEDDAPLRLLNESLDEFLSAVDQLSPDNCQSALAGLFSPGPSHIFITVDANHAPSSETVAATYQSSRETALAAGNASTPDVAFAYADFGPPGSVASRSEVAGLGITQLHFANGVRVNLKPTTFEAGQVRFLIRLGYGRMSEPADQPGLALWFPFLWEGGTGKHTAAELRRFSGGLNGFNTSTLDDASVLKGSLPRGNLAQALRELTALVSDPAFRDEGWEPTRSILRGFTGPLWNRADGPVAQFVLPLLAGNDSRIGIPSDAKWNARTAGQFRSWFGPQLKSGPIELSLVGDFQVPAVVGELTRTFGALPARDAADSRTFDTELEFHRDRQVARYYFQGAADRACSWEFFWWIRDPVTSRERRHIEMLASIFGDRVQDEVRERKGSSYRVGAGVSWNDVYPGFSFIRCSVDHKPADREKHTRAVRKLGLEIAKKGITSDELDRAKAQALAALSSRRFANEYWIEEVLADSQRRPARLESERSAENDLRAASVGDINILASRYFGPDRVFHYLILPSGLMPKKE